MHPLKTLLCASALTLAAAPAFAAMSVSATTDLNVRTGPGPQYPVQGVIGANESATMQGCLENSKWCQVTVDGQTGWAYSEYLVADYSGEPTIVYQNRDTIGVPVVTYEDDADGAVAGIATGAVTGAIIGGPVGAAVGGAAGAVIGEAIDPDATRTYITENPVDPVYLEGEVVVGAQLPPDVQLYELPEAPAYRYVYVNGQPVLVQPDSREIVYVYR